MKLLSVKKSNAKGKKWVATFQDGEKTKKVNFGASGYTDYTKGATEEQRKSYRARHSSGATAKPDTPNALSYYILWGDSKSLATNLSTFKKKYNL
jgi:hypothetical protein